MINFIVIYCCWFASYILSYFRFGFSNSWEKVLAYIMWVIQAAYNYQIYLPNIFHAQQKVYVWRVLMQKNYIPGFKQLFLGLFFLVKRRNFFYIWIGCNPYRSFFGSLNLFRMGFFGDANGCGGKWWSLA